MKRERLKLLPDNFTRSEDDVALPGLARRIFQSLFLGLLLVLHLVSPANALAKESGDDASSGDFPVVITAGADHAIKKWDTSGRLDKTLGTHDESLTALVRTGSLLFSSSSDGVLKSWDLSTGKLADSAKQDKDRISVTSLAVTSDGSLVAAGREDGSIRLYDGHLNRISEFPKAHGGAVRSIKFTGDSTKLISGSADQMIRTWMVKRVGGKVSGIEYQSNIVSHDVGVNEIALTSDDAIVASISEDGYLKTWKLKDGSQILRIKLGGQGMSLAISPDGKQIATGDRDGKIKLWNFETGTQSLFTAVHDRSVLALVWSADGKTLISGSEDKTLRFWEIASGKQRAKITAHDGAVLAIILP